MVERVKRKAQHEGILRALRISFQELDQQADDEMRRHILRMTSFEGTIFDSDSKREGESDDAD